jgi:ribonucleoside-diphosphate reductase alpha chain
MVQRHPAARNSQLDLPKVPLLSKDYLTEGKAPAEASAVTPSISVEVVDVKDRAWVQETDAPPCHECGTLMVRNGACHKCPNCGSTSGCS